MNYFSEYTDCFEGKIPHKLFKCKYFNKPGELTYAAPVLLKKEKKGKINPVLKLQTQRHKPFPDRDKNGNLRYVLLGNRIWCNGRITKMYRALKRKKVDTVPLTDINGVMVGEAILGVQNEDGGQEASLLIHYVHQDVIKKIEEIKCL